MKRENGLFEDTSGVSLRESLAKYLAYWPLYLLSVALCVGAGYIYTRYTTAKYQATTSVLILGDESGSVQAADIIEDALNGKRSINLNNEILLLKSVQLMERVVSRHNFNTTYFSIGKVLDVEIYLDAPFRLEVLNIKDSARGLSIQLEGLSAAGGKMVEDPAQKDQTKNFKWNEAFRIGGNTFVLRRSSAKADKNYKVTWQLPYQVAGPLSQQLSVQSKSKETSAIELSIVLENLQKAKDLLNAVATEFNLADIEDRRKLSENTVRFIDERLTNISGELQGVEGNLEKVQVSRELSDIKTQSTQSIQGSDQAAGQIRDLNVQQGVVNMLVSYFNNPANGAKLVPSSLGLNDPTLASLITNYNELQLRKERDAPLVAPNSTVMEDINTQLASLRSSIRESLGNISRNLRLQSGSMQQQNAQYRQFLSAVPRNERVLQEIKRKQSITEGLYLYLLQKREEAAISSTATEVPHYRQIDPASGWGPVEPNKRNVIVYAALLGLCLSFGAVYLLDLLNEKVKSKSDITKRTALPILGQVAHIPKRKQQLLAVLDRNVIGEQFRALRTNLSFISKNGEKKVMLVTSAASGDGKSFVSLNLAAVYALAGKKVALLEFDIRRPSISSKLDIESSIGLTNYLSGDVDDLTKIFQVTGQVDNLHVYPCGSIPPNPGDLLLSGHMEQLFQSMREQYDIVIVDTSPAGLVSDPVILGNYCDHILFVVRNQKTSKKQVEEIDELVRNHSLEDASVVYNDVELDKHYGYYGYGYTVKKSERVSKKRKSSVLDA